MDNKNIEEWKKSHGAGNLRIGDVGSTVVLMGWVSTVYQVG